MAETDKFEKATLMSFYYVIKEGAPYDPLDEDTYQKIKARPSQYTVPKVTKKTKTKPEFTVEQELSQKMAKSMLTEYPNMDYDKWYLGILRGAAALNEDLGYKKGHKDSCWLYGHFGSGAGLSRVSEIPNGENTDILDYVWNSFSPEMKDVFDKKKDSWNTADVYMVKKNDVTEIKKGIEKALCIGHRHDKLLADIGWCLGIAEVNTYMSSLISQKKLLPLSLKQATPRVNIKITPTNMKKDPDGVEGLEGNIQIPMRNLMVIEREDNKWGKNVPAFKTNSLTFVANFEQGDVGFKYKYESKISSNENHATEPRDMVMNNKSKYVQANARNGSVPASKMADLVKEFTKVSDINHMIPMNRKLNFREVNYWADKYRSIKPKNKIRIDFGKNLASTIDGSKKTRDNFILEASILDGGRPFSGGKYTTSGGGKEDRTANFDAEFRSKLRLLRYMEMFLNASDKNPSQLGEVLATIYFLSSKVNFKKGQLSGPFIKVQ